MSLKICFFAIFSVVIASIIKHVRADFLPYLRIGISVIVGALAVSVASPMLTYIGSLFEGTSLTEWGSTVLKALGIALIVQICSDICKDCGENSAALGVELIGKLEIVALCIPLLQSIITTAREVLKW